MTGEGIRNLYNHECTLCPLHEHAKTVCVEASGQQTRYQAMIVGEAPGRNEDAIGTPFVGVAGRILNRALHRAFYPGSKLQQNFARRDLFVTNAVKCRPLANAQPSESDIDVCVSAYLTREIEAVNATTLLACGNAAAQALLGQTGIIGLRGEWHRLDSDEDRRVRVTYHPAWVVYQGGYPSKAFDLFFEDVQLFAERVLDGSV